MREFAKIDRRGRITVPLAVRQELDVGAGDSIVFEKSKAGTVTVRPVRKDSPFAKYRGIGTPGIGSGLKAVNRYIREIRGFDPDHPTVQ